MCQLLAVAHATAQQSHQDELEQGALVHLHKLVVPGLDLLLALARLLTAFLRARLHMVLAVLDHLCDRPGWHIRMLDIPDLRGHIRDAMREP